MMPGCPTDDQGSGRWIDFRVVVVVAATAVLAALFWPCVVQDT